MAASSADYSKSNKIVFLYDKKDKQKYEDIKGVLRELLVEKEEDYEICSYDNIPPGGYITTGLNDLISPGCIIVMIMTNNFIEDSQTGYESALAIVGSFKTKRFIIPIKFDDCPDIPGTLNVFKPIDGSEDVNSIAEQIMLTVKDHKKTSSATSDGPQQIIVNEYDQKSMKLVKKAASYLIDHYAMDDKLKNLHRKRKEEIDIQVNAMKKNDSLVSESGGKLCSCSEGELWKKEISKKEHWTIGKDRLQRPDPGPSIEKSGVKKKHTHDIHQLFKTENGYLQFASVFMTKEQKQTAGKSESNSLSEYMDGEGLLQLLLRCSLGPSDDDIRKNINKLKELRHSVAHSESKISIEDAKEMIQELGNSIKGFMDGILKREKDVFHKELDEIVNAEVTMTIHPEGEASVTTQPTQSTSSPTDVMPNIQDLDLSKSSSDTEEPVNTGPAIDITKSCDTS